MQLRAIGIEQQMNAAIAFDPLTQLHSDRVTLDENGV